MLENRNNHKLNLFQSVHVFLHIFFLRKEWTLLINKKLNNSTKGLQNQNIGEIGISNMKLMNDISPAKLTQLRNKGNWAIFNSNVQL